jgi:hypothetical protein
VRSDPPYEETPPNRVVGVAARRTHNTTADDPIGVAAVQNRRAVERLAPSGGEYEDVDTRR